jgi:ankyrin repeat protein
MLHAYMQKGMSPLCIASEKDHMEVAEVLLEYRPHVNLQNNVRPFDTCRSRLDRYYSSATPELVVLQFIVHHVHIFSHCQ